MCGKVLCYSLVLLLLPAVALGSGKIRGTVTDVKTGEALVGANVVVEGTAMGASTDVNGQFTILNVPAGSYSLRASIIGYQDVTIANVRVNEGLTTEESFKLPEVGVTLAAVEIVAQRPLVNKNATNAVRIIDRDFFDKLPARGVAAAVALQPGVVTQNNNVYIRGGRLDETGFSIDGVNAKNVLYGGTGVSLSAEALEQIQVLAGGYNAEFGGANAGIVSGQIRLGNPDRWNGTALVETDRFTGQSKEGLGGYSYGYSDYTVTFGGPLTSKLRVFGSAENTFYRDAGMGGTQNGLAGTTLSLTPSPVVFGGLDFTGANALITDPVRTAQHPNVAIPDTLNLYYPGGNLTGGSWNRYNFAGSAIFELGTLQIRGSGSYSSTVSQDPTTIVNIFNSARNPLREMKDGFANLKLSHFLSSTVFYEANFNYYNNSFVVEDPFLKSDINAYGDSAANAALGFQYRGESSPYDPWSIFGGFPSGVSLNQPGTPQVDFSETKQYSLGGSAAVTAQLSRHEIKAGGDYSYYTIRRFEPGSTLARAKIIADHPGDIATQTRLLRQVNQGIDNYGYDINGNPIDGNLVSGSDITDFGPRHPVFAAAYVQDKIEFSDIVLNLGLRYDYINPDSWALKDPQHITFNDSLGVISTSSFEKTSTTSHVSPRLGFSFPVTDRTVFHAQYGTFIQQDRLRDSYIGNAASYGIIKGGFFVQNTVGWGLKPERSTQYEIGFSQQLSDVASFDITGFYKDITNQITYTQILPGAGATQQSYPAFINGDFATSKGLEIKFNVRRTQRVAAQIDYTFSDTRGTGSNPTTAAGAVVASGQPGFTPKYIFPTTFNQPHRGNISLDYRFGKDDGGPILSQLGLNLLGQFNSGFSFTRLQIDEPSVTDPRSRVPIEEIGASTTPWFFQLDARLDKAVPIGPFSADVYVYVINLLGTDNPVSAFPRTGDPADDGWLSTPNGIDKAQTLGPQYVALYRAMYDGKNAFQGGTATPTGSAAPLNGLSNYGPPRQIRFGIKLEY